MLPFEAGERRAKLSKDRLESWLTENDFTEHTSRPDEWCRSWCSECGEGKDWRLMVNSRTGWVNCYGCGQGWKNVFRWVAREAGVSLSEAVQLVGDDGTVDVELVWRDVQAEVAQEQAALRIEPPDVHALWWDGSNPTVPWMAQALAATEQRGFTREFLLAKRIGFGLSGRWTMRVVLPVFHQGHFVWAQAWDWTRQSTIKYQSPPHVEGVVGRRQILYQHDLYAASAGPLVVTEGVFNAWSCEQVGYPAEASFGKALTEEQLLLLAASIPSPIILALDGDARRQAAAAARELISLGKPALLPSYPDDRDLNDHSPEARAALLAAAQPPHWFEDAPAPRRAALPLLGPPMGRSL